MIVVYKTRGIYGWERDSREEIITRTRTMKRWVGYLCHVQSTSFHGWISVDSFTWLKELWYHWEVFWMWLKDSASLLNSSYYGTFVRCIFCKSEHKVIDVYLDFRLYHLMHIVFMRKATLLFYKILLNQWNFFYEGLEKVQCLVIILNARQIFSKNPIKFKNRVQI